QSAPGLGSTFTLEIAADLTQAAPAGAETASPPPQIAPMPAVAASTIAPSPTAAPPRTGRPDDRYARKRERLILVIEDDDHFASILYELVHELNFDCVLASTGAEAIGLARELRPSGILLDVGLPDQSGLSVLERLKRESSTRHIPIHML